MRLLRGLARCGCVCCEDLRDARCGCRYCCEILSSVRMSVKHCVLECARCDQCQREHVSVSSIECSSDNACQVSAKQSDNVSSVSATT